MTKKERGRENLREWEWEWSVRGRNGSRRLSKCGNAVPTQHRSIEERWRRKKSCRVELEADNPWATRAGAEQCEPHVISNQCAGIVAPTISDKHGSYKGIMEDSVGLHIDSTGMWDLDSSQLEYSQGLLLKWHLVFMARGLDDRGFGLGTRIWDSV